MWGLVSIHNHVSQSLITRLFLNINVSIYVLLVLLLWIILTHALALRVVLPWTRVTGQPPGSRLQKTECSMQEVLLESKPMEEKSRTQVRVEGELGL